MSGEISMVSSKTIISPRRGIFGEERGGAEDSEGEVEFDNINMICAAVVLCSAAKPLF